MNSNIGRDCWNIIFDYKKQLEYMEFLQELHFRNVYQKVLVELRLYHYHCSSWSSMEKIRTDIILISNGRISSITN